MVTRLVCRNTRIHVYYYSSTGRHIGYRWPRSIVNMFYSRYPVYIGNQHNAFENYWCRASPPRESDSGRQLFLLCFILSSGLKVRRSFLVVRGRVINEPPRNYKQYKSTPCFLGTMYLEYARGIALHRAPQYNSERLYTTFYSHGLSISRQSCSIGKWKTPNCRCCSWYMRVWI